MRRSTMGLALVLVAGGCESSPPAGSSGGAATATATIATSATAASATATATASAAPAPTASASAEPEDNPCDDHDLAKGKGTKADPCRFDNDVLTADYAGRNDEAGAVFMVNNPWSEEVTWLEAATYYYDADGKQLTFTVDDAEKLAARQDRVTVKIPGGMRPQIALGLKREQIPEGAATIEARILGFGYDEVVFRSSRPFSPYRGVNDGHGPTNIEACDNYRAKLETCKKRLGDVYHAMRKSLRQYNNAAPKIQAKLAPGLTERCEKGMEAIAERCKPDDEY